MGDEKIILSHFTEEENEKKMNYLLQKCNKSIQKFNEEHKSLL